MSPAGKRPDRPRPAPGPALALLPPAHRTVLCALAILAVAAARPAPPRPAPLTQRADAPASAGTQPAAWADTGILPASPDELPPPRPRPGQGQRPRSPPPAAPGHHADDRRRPPARLLLVPLAATAPGPRPLPPLPDPAPGNTHMTSRLGRRYSGSLMPVAVLAETYLIRTLTGR
jgi:hypothetical protein